MTHRPRMRARRRLIKTGAQTALDVCAILGIDERKMLRPPGAQPYSLAREALPMHWAQQEAERKRLSKSLMEAYWPDDEPLTHMVTVREPTFKPEIKRIGPFTFKPEHRLANTEFSDEARERIITRIQEAITREQDEAALTGRPVRDLVLVMPESVHDFSYFESRLLAHAMQLGMADEAKYLKIVLHDE